MQPFKSPRDIHLLTGYLSPPGDIPAVPDETTSHMAAGSNSDTGGPNYCGWGVTGIPDCIYPETTIITIVDNNSAASTNASSIHSIHYMQS